MQLRQGLEGWRTTGAAISLRNLSGLLADVCRVREAQVQEGLAALAEALACVDKTGERTPKRSCIGSRASCCSRRRLLGQSQAESCFPARPSHCPTPAGEVVGTPCYHEPQSPVAAPGQASSSGTSCSRRSTVGSPKALPRLICKKPGHYSTS